MDGGRVNSTHARATAQSGRRAKALDREALLEAFERNRQRDVDAAQAERPRRGPHLELEAVTKPFRKARARAHFDEVRLSQSDLYAARAAWSHVIENEAALAPSYPTRAERDAFVDACEVLSNATEVMREAISRMKWHRERGIGQLERFDRVRNCGTRMVLVKCLFCRNDSKPTPEGCGVRRVCDRCDVHGAIKRRARFGRARYRVLLKARAYGLLIKNRPGGAYGEKMLTLTLPHVLREHCTRPRRGQGPFVVDAPDDVAARILAINLAWTRMNRKMRDYFTEAGIEFVQFHRAFEWTPGSDGLGHPHFHVYLFCPWIDVAMLRAMWAEALREVGVPVLKRKDGTNVISVDLRSLRSFGPNELHELMKGGRKGALELAKVEAVDGRPIQGQLYESRMHHGPGNDSFKYADGWTIGDVLGVVSDDVAGSLYCALEGRRLTQANRGFFEEDPPPECKCCGSSQFWIRFESPHIFGSSTTKEAAPSRWERGPPS